MGDALIVDVFYKKDGTLTNYYLLKEILSIIKIQENLKVQELVYIPKGLTLTIKCQVVKVVTLISTQ